MAGAKDDRRDAYVVGDSVRTDRRLFRRVHVTDPRLVELRAWSRLAEELTEERVRSSNRVHHELWRYYPQMLKIADGDVGSRSVGSRAHAGQSAPVARGAGREIAQAPPHPPHRRRHCASQLARACHQSWQGRGRGSQRSSAFAVYPVACRQPRTAAGRRLHDGAVAVCDWRTPCGVEFAVGEPPRVSRRLFGLSHARCPWESVPA